ncbi:MAG TPA: methyltransferase domain-containing protein [Ktedonobacteraceae bacterium]|nr:methyltransferase domain-containing protein [Ktedonobacteraceae bacterium]
METPPLEGNTFVIDESTAEMTWLLNQDQILTKGMGELFPESIDLSNVKNILDVACGPGGWVLDVARHYPDVEVIGFDIGKDMINYARAHASARGLRNAHFMVMDALRPFDFPDNSFDFVNARTMVGFMFPAAWPRLLQEMMRVCRPGGTIRLTEFELPVTNSPAFEQIGEMCIHATQLAKRNFSPDTRHFGITPMLGRFLRDAGCRSIERQTYSIDFSAGTEDHESVYQDYMIVYQLIQPFLLKMQVTTPKDIQRIYQQMLVEMYREDFCGVWYYLSTWGRKPM